VYSSIVEFNEENDNEDSSGSLFDPTMNQPYRTVTGALTNSAYFIVVTVFFLAVPCYAANDTVTEIPFTLEQGVVIAKMMIHGNDPVEVALATGSEYSVFNPRLAKQHKLLAVPLPVGPTFGGRYPARYMTVITDIRFGNLTIGRLQLRSGEDALAAIGAKIGREIFAALGAEFFKGRRIRFDFTKRVLSFPARLSDDQLKGKSVLKMKSTETHLPIVSGASFNGKQIDTIFDTGAAISVYITPAGAK